MDLLNKVPPSIFYVMRNCEVDSTLSIVHFLFGYISTLKASLNLRRSSCSTLITLILEVIRIQICYYCMYRNNYLNALDQIGLEEEDRMPEFRKDPFVLLRTMGRVAPKVTQHFTRNSLANAVESSSERNDEEGGHEDRIWMLE